MDKIQDLANKLNMPVTQLLEIYSRQVYAQSLTDATVSIGFIIIFLCLSIICTYKCNVINELDDYSRIREADNWASGAFWSLIALIVTLFFITLHSDDIVAGILNPEYIAINKLLK